MTAASPAQIHDLVAEVAELRKMRDYWHEDSRVAWALVEELRAALEFERRPLA